MARLVPVPPAVAAALSLGAALLLAAPPAGAHPGDSSPPGPPAPWLVADGDDGEGAPAPEPTPEELEERRRARERWEKMTPEERRALMERYERFRDLPADRQEDLRRLLDEMGGPQGAALVRDKLEEARASDPDHMEKMRLQASVIDRFEKRLAGMLPPGLRERYEGLGEEVREEVRKRAFGEVMALGRKIFIEKYATPVERERLAKAASGTARDRGERDAIMGLLYARARERVLDPEKERLEALSPEERRREEWRLWDRAYWTTMELHGKEVAAVLEKVLATPGEKDDPSRRFKELFGVTPEQLGVEDAPRALTWSLHVVSSARRERFLAAAREGLERIVRLPRREREAAFRDLLAVLRREDPPELPPREPEEGR